MNHECDRGVRTKERWDPKAASLVAVLTCLSSRMGRLTVVRKRDRDLFSQTGHSLCTSYTPSPSRGGKTQFLWAWGGGRHAQMTPAGSPAPRRGEAGLGWAGAGADCAEGEREAEAKRMHRRRELLRWQQQYRATTVHPCMTLHTSMRTLQRHTLHCTLSEASARSSSCCPP